MYLDGVELISNGVGSVGVLPDPHDAYTLMKNATVKSGGCYLLANQRGCDGQFSVVHCLADSVIGNNEDLILSTKYYSRYL